jgi:frataxin-like iron-binding protein CyaY
MEDGDRTVEREGLREEYCEMLSAVVKDKAEMIASGDPRVIGRRLAQLESTFSAIETVRTTVIDSEVMGQIMEAQMAQARQMTIHDKEVTLQKWWAAVRTNQKYMKPDGGWTGGHGSRRY